jgi:hypothetical protein
MSSAAGEEHGCALSIHDDLVGRCQPSRDVTCTVPGATFAAFDRDRRSSPRRSLDCGVLQRYAVAPMEADSTRRVSWAGLIASTGLALLGCSELVGADDYASKAPRYHGLPQRAGGDACEQCVAAKCASEWDACMADPDCDRAIACVATRPGWAHECEIAVDVWRHDILGAPAGCVEDACSAECNAGRVWSCAQSYALPRRKAAATSASIFIRYMKSEAEGFPGIAVKACKPAVDPAQDCDLAAQATTDANGEARLEVDLQKGGVIGQPGFDGYLELRSEANAPAPRVSPHLRFLKQPVVWDILESGTLIDEATVSAMLELWAKKFPDIPPGAISIEPRDCLGMRAPDVQFELSPAPAHVLYLDGLTGAIDWERDRTTRKSMAIAIGLPETGDVLITARVAGAPEPPVVWRRRIFNRAGFGSVVLLAPDPRE